MGSRTIRLHVLFEAYVLALAKTMAIDNAAGRSGEHDARLWRIIEHYVWRAGREARFVGGATHHRRRNFDGATTTSACSLTWRKVVHAADGRDAATVKEFVDLLEARGGRARR
jgi:hypothetical protein